MATNSKKGNVLDPSFLGSVMWLINDNCNYNCDYCFTSSHHFKSKEMIKNYNLFIDKFRKNIPKQWNFYIAGGGEPTIHPDFYKIVKSLVDSQYNISLITNLSMSFENIDKFFGLVKDRCVFLSASLHLEKTSFKDFYSKINYIKNNYLNKKRIDVSSVAIPERLTYLNKCNKIFSRSSINFRLQNYMHPDGEKHFYSFDQLSVIKEINKNKIFLNFKRSNSCICGYKYIVVNPGGDVFRCVADMRQKKSMGNILNDNFNFYKEVKKCNYDNCFCGDKDVADLLFALNN